jgi:hypothetical protein
LPEHGLTLDRLPLHYAESVQSEGGPVTRPRAADDFATIRARMDELRRTRDGDAADRTGGSKPQPGRGGSDAEHRRRERIEGWPPPWVPTIFVRKPPT